MNTWAKRSLIGLSAVLAGVATQAHVASAASASFFGPIISPACQCPGKAPDFGCVLQTVQNSINLGVSMGVILFMLVAVYAGFLFITTGGSSASKEKAKTLALNIFVGLALLLASWLIVDYIMKTLYNENSQFGPWNSILKIDPGHECITVNANPQSLTNGIATVLNPGVTVGSSAAQGTAANTASGNEDAVRAQLSGAGIQINKGSCPVSAGTSCGGSPPSCTNVGGLQSATIQQAINISSALGNTGVVITGGSEPGHACGPTSHGGGYKLDLRNGGALDTLLKSLKSAGTRTGDGPGPAWTDSCGNQYVLESDHWDITVTSSCSLK